MSKTSNVLEMLHILSYRNIVKVSELAEIIGTNARNIIEYKKELEYCGYYIESIPGKYGGYRLDKERILPSINLNTDEKNALISASEYLMSRDDFLLKDTYNKALAKIAGSIKIPDYTTNYKVITRFPLIIGENELRVRFKLLENAIHTRSKVQIVYDSQKNKSMTYIFHPYDLFMYNNSWFVIGWNELYGDVNYLKINRIKEIFKLDDTFSVWKLYDLHNYVDDFGFKNNRQWYYVKFLATDKLAGIVRERRYGRYQTTEVIDDAHTIVSAEMHSREAAISFLLAHADQLEVLEPQELKDELVEIAYKIEKTYKRRNNE